MANPGEMTGALLRDPRRWAITLGGVAVYGLGSRLWLPGLNPGAAAGLTVPIPSADLSIFGVGARPMLFGLAFAEMARLAIPPFARWAAGAHDRSERLWRWRESSPWRLRPSRPWKWRRAIERLDDIAPSPGPIFRLGVVVAIVGATAFLIWLARVMTERGIGTACWCYSPLQSPRICPMTSPTALRSSGPGSRPLWAPLALAALVVGAVVLLVASTRAARSDGRLDIWPPLLGMIVLQILTFVVYLLADPLVDAVPPYNSTPGVARRAGRPYLAVRRMARARRPGERPPARRRNPRLQRRALIVARAWRRRPNERLLAHPLRRRWIERGERQRASGRRAVGSDAHGLI